MYGPWYKKYQIRCASKKDPFFFLSRSPPPSSLSLLPPFSLHDSMRVPFHALRFALNYDAGTMEEIFANGHDRMRKSAYRNEYRLVHQMKRQN